MVQNFPLVFVPYKNLKTIFRLINHVMKHGSSWANTFGVISLMYSGFGVFFSWARGVDDYYNTAAASTATGMLFKSTGEIYT